MSFILTSGAVLRLLAANRSDPITEWIEKDRIRPYIATATMAQALDSIRMSGAVKVAERKTFERRYQGLVLDLQSDSRKSVLSAVFDYKSCEILADLLGVEVSVDEIGEMDLIPAAIAIQHNLELVVTQNVEAWKRFAAALPAETGRLALHTFPGATE